MLPQALLRLCEVGPLPCPGGDMLGLPAILLAHLCKYYKGVERAERWEPGNLLGSNCSQPNGYLEQSLSSTSTIHTFKNSREKFFLGQL